MKADLRMKLVNELTPFMKDIATDAIYDFFGEERAGNETISHPASVPEQTEIKMYTSDDAVPDFCKPPAKLEHDRFLRRADAAEVLKVADYVFDVFVRNEVISASITDPSNGQKRYSYNYLVDMFYKVRKWQCSAQKRKNKSKIPGLV